MKTLKRLAIGVPTLFILMQFLGPEKTNPPINPAQTLKVRLNPNPQVSALLERACQNCHSHKTQWPWYSNVAPVSWFVIDHVNHARQHMNFSDWVQYSREETIGLLEDMCKLVKEGEMPLPPYLWMHDEAHLTQEDINLLCEWTRAQQKRLMSQPGN